MDYTITKDLGNHLFPFFEIYNQLHGMDGMHEWIHVGIVMLVLIKKEESECKRSLDANA